MSGWRTNLFIKKNNADGTEDMSQKFRFIGQALNFSRTPTNNTKSYNTMGSKFVDLISAGKFAVSGSMETYLDFANFYYLIGCFEQYTTSVEYNAETGKFLYHHMFEKTNYKRVPSFTLIAQKLNRAVGGPDRSDETIKLFCVVFNSIDFTFDGSSSANVKVKMNWWAIDEETEFGNLDGFINDIERFESHPIEWGCLSIYDDKEGYVPIANSEMVTVSMSTTLFRVGQCGSRFDADISEGNTGLMTVSTKVYSRTGEWMRRLYSGGYDKMVDAEGKPLKNTRPLRKYLKPIKKMLIKSDDTSAYQSRLYLTDTIVNSMPQSFSPTSEIMDSPSLSCAKLALELMTPDININIYTRQPITPTFFQLATPPEEGAIVGVPEIKFEGMGPVGTTVRLKLNTEEQGVTVNVDEYGMFWHIFKLPEYGEYTVEMEVDVPNQERIVKTITFRYMDPNNN